MPRAMRFGPSPRPGSPNGDAHRGRDFPRSRKLLMPSFASYPSLVDRSVLITGGASGIGAGLVEHFARQGARVAFLDVDDAGARQVLEQLTDVSHAPVYLHCELTDVAALQATIAAARARIGPIAVLVNNAANDVRQALADIDVAGFERNVAVNLRHQVF